MDKQLQAQLKLLVNNPKLWAALCEYYDGCIDKEYTNLEQAQDMGAVNKTQGSIARLRKLKQLRDEVNT